jgi:hypothetical protein
VPPPLLPAVTSAGIPEAATDGAGSPETGGFPSSGKWLTAAQIEQLADDDTCPNAMLAKAWPARPAWVAEAFISSVAVVKEKFGPARQGPVPCRLLSPMTVKLMLEPTAAGIESLHAHADRVLRLFSVFAARGPLPPEYAEMFNRVFVPTYNAINFDSRRCLDCGKVFALRTSTDIEKSRHCSDACDRRASKRGRERVGNGRSGAENAALKFDMKCQSHKKNCQICRSKKHCPTAESLFNRAIHAHDALDRQRGAMPRSRF